MDLEAGTVADFKLVIDPLSAVDCHATAVTLPR
jgi:hypothetical protein